MSRSSSPSRAASPDVTRSSDRSRDALQRKRERDKRSQRNKRQREREYIASLETRIRELEAATTLVHHAHGDTIIPEEEPWLDERERNRLSQRIVSEGLRRPSIATIAITDIPRSSLSPGTSRNVNTGVALLSPDATSSEHDAILSPAGRVPSDFGDGGKEKIVVSPSLLSNLLSTPDWLRVPLWNVEQPSEGYTFLTRGKGFPALIAELRSSPDFEEICPAVPKPIDLLFGGSLNPLANFVFAELWQMPFLTPEKYGACCLIYNLLRWMVWPTPDTYQRLPKCHRPTMLQLTQEHHLSFDFLIWPQMRDNLIKYGARYELEGVMGLVCATLRLRGSFGADFIERRNGEEPQVKEDFYQQVFDISRYGLLQRFWEVSTIFNDTIVRSYRGK